MPAYVKHLPVALNVTYVKASSYYSSSYYQWIPFDITTALTGGSNYTAWLSSTNSVPQRINVDHGFSFVLKKLYLENYHDTGGSVNFGIKTFRVYGTNSSSAFNITDGYDLTDLTLLGEFVANAHVASNVEDPQYFYISGNSTEYRYTCFIFTDVITGGNPFLGFRRLVCYSEHENLEIVTSDLKFFTRAIVEQKFIQSKYKETFEVITDLWKRGAFPIVLVKDKFSYNFYTTSSVGSKYFPQTKTKRIPTYINGDINTNTDGYLSGTVTVSGVIWPNAVVRLYYEVDGNLIKSTLTDSNGNFIFDFIEVKKSYYTVIAYKNGFNSIVYSNITAAGYVPPIVLPPPPPETPLYWSPLQISSELWLTVNDLSTIIESGTGIAAWNDKSGKNKNAVQSDDNKKPTRTADGVVFDESDEQLRISTPYSSNQSIFIVLKSLDDTFVIFGSGSQTNYGISGMSGNTAFPVSAGFGTPIIRRDGSLVSWTTRDAVYQGLYNRFSILSLDNVVLSGWSYMDLFFYDAAYLQYSLQGIIKELVILGTNASAYNRVLMEGYLAWEHNLTDNLPSTHSFKTVRPLNCVSVYPPQFSSSYVKSTTVFSANYNPEFAVDTSKSLTGDTVNNCFLSGSLTLPQKFNIDYGVPFIPRCVYIENIHHNGGYTYNGIKNMSIYGTNSSIAFNNTDGGTLTDLTLLSNIVVREHISADESDPQFFTFDNTVSYKYIVCVITSLYSPVTWFGIRRISFQKRA